MFSWLNLFKRPSGAQHTIAPVTVAHDELYGVPMRYMIGVKGAWRGVPGELIMHSYDSHVPALEGLSGKYFNLWSEDGEVKRYGPYRQQAIDGTAMKYKEGRTIGDSDGFWRNLQDQMSKLRVAANGRRFTYCEYDNRLDFKIYGREFEAKVIDYFAKHGLQCFIKNPENDDGWLFQHPNVCGAIIENGGTEPAKLHTMRTMAHRPTLAVRYVTFNDDDDGMEWGDEMGATIRAHGYVNMGVTYDGSAKEYSTCRDVLFPLR